MIKHTIKGGLGNSILLIGEYFKNVMTYVPEGLPVLFITDDNVYQLYDRHFQVNDVIRIGTGETIKTLDTVRHLYQELLNRKADRSTFIVGVGGGIVCDITGFVASTYMRGLRYGFISSTLLAQVDASVGGKNGVNFKGYKNLVGVFNQPEFVICDINLLKTLPKRELLCGFAEIIKTAVIADESLFAYLEQTQDRAENLDGDVIEKLVCESVLIKAHIVNADEKETGVRRKLNFGHTFGHAVEKATGMPHGQAVSIGMALALMLSMKIEGLSKESADRIIKLLHQFNLPVDYNGDWEPIFNALEKDKKKAGNHIHFVLLKEIGNAIVKKMPIDNLISLTRQYNSS
jgi:3-dehydroquinate synthase